jgi:hypothetical protein
MTGSHKPITERQQYWLDHILAADVFNGTLVEYASVEGLKVKDLYQWKTLLSRRGLLPGKKSSLAFVAVTASVLPPVTSMSMLLPNGVRLQFDGKVDAKSLGDILSAASQLS